MQKNFLKNKNVLITSGPTWVPIDSMRVISNQSSGQFASCMAKDFLKAGANVTVIEGPVISPIQTQGIKVIKFCFYDELVATLKNELSKKYDVVVHAAAVSDYKLKKPFKKKVSSDQNQISWDLVRTPKVINLIKKVSPQSLLVGFKLEDSFEEKSLFRKVQKLFDEAKCDFVIANSLKANKYCGYLIDHDLVVSRPIEGRDQMSQFLINTLKFIEN